MQGEMARYAGAALVQYAGDAASPARSLDHGESEEEREKREGGCGNAMAKPESKDIGSR